MERRETENDSVRAPSTVLVYESVSVSVTECERVWREGKSFFMKINISAVCIIMN